MKLLWQLATCCSLRDKSFWKTIWRWFYLPPTSNGLRRCRMKYYQVMAQKLWTQACIRCPSDMENIEFHWKDPDLNMNAVFRPSIDTPFSPSIFNSFTQILMAENKTSIDGEQDNGNSSPVPTTPVSNRQTHLPLLMRCHPLEQHLRMFPILITGFCLNESYFFHCVHFSMLTINNVFHFFKNSVKIYSDMLKTKTFLVSLSKLFLVAASFCNYQVQSEKKVLTEKQVGHHSEIKIQSPCENEYKKHPWNCEYCHLVDEYVVGGDCSLWYGKKTLWIVHAVGLQKT